VPLRSGRLCAIKSRERFMTAALGESRSITCIAASSRGAFWGGYEDGELEDTRYLRRDITRSRRSAEALNRGAGASARASSAVSAVLRAFSAPRRGRISSAGRVPSAGNVFASPDDECGGRLRRGRDSVGRRAGGRVGRLEGLRLRACGPTGVAAHYAGRCILSSTSATGNHLIS